MRNKNLDFSGSGNTLDFPFRDAKPLPWGFSVDRTTLKWEVVFANWKRFHSSTYMWEEAGMNTTLIAC